MTRTLFFIINSYQVTHTSEASGPTEPPLDEEHFEGDTDEAAESVNAINSPTYNHSIATVLTVSLALPC